MDSKLKLGLGLTVVLVLAATTVPTTYAAPPTDACSLLTTAQVSAVLGIKAGAGKPLSPTSTNLCQWGAPVLFATTAKKGVILTLQNPLAFAYAKMPVGHGIIKVPVSGIGDDAVYGSTPGYATVLTVKKGDVVFVVHVSGFPDDQIKTKEKTLALDVLAKL